MNLRGITALFVCLAVTGIAAAAPKVAPLPSVDIPYEKFVLDNGLTLIVHEDHKAPIVAVNIWYHVGSKDEGPGRTGVSHWVEHMNFKGTINIPREEMKGIVERLGGMWNGYTWIDQTTYLETAGRSALDRLLFIEVPEAKQVKNRVHFDLDPVEGSRDEELARLLELGATVVDDRRLPDGTGWVVLADPEGNEFCVQ